MTTTTTTITITMMVVTAVVVIIMIMTLLNQTLDANECTRKWPRIRYYAEGDSKLNYSVGKTMTTNSQHKPLRSGPRSKVVGDGEEEVRACQGNNAVITPEWKLLTKMPEEERCHKFGMETLHKMTSPNTELPH